ncbi:MAG: hypothetical protein ACR2OR_13650 [Hyphomicrobiales bacterium]
MATCGTYTVDLANADELAAFYRSLTSTNTTFSQLSPGPSRFHARTLELDRISISWITSSGCHFWHDLMIEGGWRFAFATGSEGTLRLNGQELSYADAQLLQSGEENIFVTSGAYSTLEITMEKSLVEELGWSSSAGQLRRIQETQLGALQMLCETAYSDISGNSRARAPGTEMRWQSVLLEHLEQALGPWLHGGEDDENARRIQRSHRILKEMHENYFDESGFSFLNIDALAGRTAYRAGRSLRRSAPNLDSARISLWN